jgi:hypothetical protein
MDVQNRQAWDVIVEQREEIKVLKRNRLFLVFRPVLIAWVVGLFTPMLFQFAVVWLLPKPVRETITVVHGAWSDIVFGLQCKARNK